MNKNLKQFLAITLAVVLVMQMSFAFPTKSQGKGLENFMNKHYDKFIQNFKEIDGQLIRVKNQKVKFDTPPVIKEGRTLIPVRAITEALGAEVKWDAKDQIVTIISPDKLIQLKFYLQSGVVTKAERVSANIEFASAVVVEIDVAPGLINNRTFVPLRFIAETFGLHVKYDNDSGEIDINENPKLTPANFQFATFENIEDVKVSIKLNGHTFEGITGWTAYNNNNPQNPFDYSVKEDYPTDDMVLITLKGSKIKELAAYKNLVVFNYKLGNQETTNTFEIKLEWLKPELLIPELTAKKVVFDSPLLIGDVDVTIIPKAYTFKGIDGLSVKEDEEDQVFDYSVDGNKVTLTKAYIASLTAEKSVVKFRFTQTNMTDVLVDYTIEKKYLKESDQPAIVPTSISYTIGEALPLSFIDFNGYTLFSIDVGGKFIEGADYLLNDYTFNFTADYFKKLLGDSPVTIEKKHTFTFKNGSSFKQIDVNVTVSPAPTPAE